MEYFNIQKNFTVYIFYGSETGLSKSIADNFFNQMKKLSLYQVKIDVMNNFFNYEINLGDLCFFIISTTGEGEFPKNADEFRRKIRKVKTENIEYSLLALGNSNYKNFCHAGKITDRLLKFSGAHNLNNITLFDDAIDDNDVIEEWMIKNKNYVIEYKNNLFNWFIKSMSG